MWNEQLNITHIIDWYSSYHLPKQLQMKTKYCSRCFDSIWISTCSASMSNITVNDDIKAAKLGHEYYTLSLLSKGLSFDDKSQNISYCGILIEICYKVLHAMQGFFENYWK